jgi:CRP-like cAMP-binding protein
VAETASTGATGELPFPEHLRHFFVARARPFFVRKGQMVIAEGAEANDVYLIQSGNMQISLLSSQGRDVILRNVGPGQIVGELAAIDRGSRSANVVALADGQLASMSGPAFLQLLEDVPEAAIWLARKLAARIRDLTDKVFDLATQPVACRVQSELLRMAATAETNIENRDQVYFHSMPTHAELAARIGTHREAVSREMAQLTADGLVRQHGRSLHILSLSALTALHARLRR